MSVAFGDLTLSEFVDQLTSAAPVPGGGSASAVAGSLAAGLVSMVASLSIGRPRYRAYAATITSAGGAGRRLAFELLALGDRDAEAMIALLDASRLPRGTETEQATRTAAIDLAARKASHAPRLILAACLEIAQAAERLAGRSNLGLASDLSVASRLIEGAAHGAAENVLVNLPSVADQGEAGCLAEEVHKTVASITRLARATRRHVASHKLRNPAPSDRTASPAVLEPWE
jgi:methenyltetrahydrofolate cyclohydrolase